MVNEPHTRWIVKWSSRIVDENVKHIINTPELLDEADRLCVLRGGKTNNEFLITVTG